MNNLSANSNDVIEILLDRLKEQERNSAILQANLQDMLKKNKDLQDENDKLKAQVPHLPATDQSQENAEDPNNQ